MPVKWISNDDNAEAFKEFFRRASEGGWNLLLNYICNTRRGVRSRGNGMGGFYGARQTSLVPLNILHSQRGEKVHEKHPRIRVINPTQQALDIAHSEEKSEQEEKDALVPYRRPAYKRKQPPKKRQSKKKSQGGNTKSFPLTSSIQKKKNKKK